ncbi:uncharacterized protein LOC115275069 [Suricata suricatta]|uniref:uncharacterized protein LOC115275069 n=1 Tax=Suricata suricatta TaxID=37032 RepID=UPI001155AA37|nr:uncharacterized protein LOC115275069 [Suricata suricatta]
MDCTHFLSAVLDYTLLFSGERGATPLKASSGWAHANWLHGYVYKKGKNSPGDSSPAPWTGPVAFVSTDPASPGTWAQIRCPAPGSSQAALLQQQTPKRTAGPPHRRRGQRLRRPLGAPSLALPRGGGVSWLPGLRAGAGRLGALALEPPDSCASRGMTPAPVALRLPAQSRAAPSAAALLSSLALKTGKRKAKPPGGIGTALPSPPACPDHPDKFELNS